MHGRKVRNLFLVTLDWTIQLVPSKEKKSLSPLNLLPLMTQIWDIILIIDERNNYYKLLSEFLNCLFPRFKEHIIPSSLGEITMCKVAHMWQIGRNFKIASKVVVLYAPYNLSHSSILHTMPRDNKAICQPEK